MRNTGASLRDSARRSESFDPTGGDDSLALLIYTRTSGRPKDVMLDHANLNTMSRGVIGGFSPTRDDDSLLILPLFHVNGIVVGHLSPLLAGGRATVAGRIDPRTLFCRLVGIATASRGRTIATRN